MSDVLTSVMGGVLRLLQAGGDAVPHLLVGVITAGVAWAIGPRRVRALLGAEEGRGFLIASFKVWLVGLALPLDALGVLPVLPILTGSGVRLGLVVMFALSAPLFNPLSLAYAAGSMTLGLVATHLGLAWLFPALVGWLAERLARVWSAGDETHTPPLASLGSSDRATRAIRAVGWSAAGAGGWWRDVAWALAGTILVGAFYPNWLMDDHTGQGDPTAPLRMAGLTSFYLVNPEKLVPLLAQAEQKAGSSGASVVLTLLGVGLSLGLISYLARVCSLRLALSVLGLTLGLGLALAQAVHGFLPTRSSEYDYNHAFDQMARPPVSENFNTFFQKLRETITPVPNGTANPAAPTGLGMLLAIVVVGTIDRRRVQARRSEDSQNEAVVDPDGGPIGGGGWNVIFPQWLVVLLGGLIALGVLVGALYAFLPGPQATLDAIGIARAEVASFGAAEARSDRLVQLHAWRTALGRLDWGMRLRGQRLTPDQVHMVRTILGHLDEAIARTEAGDDEAAMAAFRQANLLHPALRTAVLEH
jgi:uncharacterized membrane protein YraQ (UPF0718 family)